MGIPRCIRSPRGEDEVEREDILNGRVIGASWKQLELGPRLKSKLEGS